MIDLHCHLLPAVDDGPATLTGSLEMARVSVAEGIRTVCCTPHMIARYPTTPERARQATLAFGEALRSEGINLEVASGAEISLDWLPRMSDDDLRAASLGGGGRWLLLELPFRGWPLHLAAVLNDLELRGFRAVLAHPERNESVQANPDRMRDPLGWGALVQVTASSFTGDHGPRAKLAAEALMRNGMVHVLASDAHSATRRPPALRDGLAAAAAVLRTDPGELTWMVDEGPRAIMAGEVVRPPRLGPAPRPRPPRPPRPPSPRGPGRRASR